MSKVLLKNVRLSFPNLFQPGTPPAGTNGTPKFGAHFIFTPDSEAYKLVSAEVMKVANDKFGKNAKAIVSEMPKASICLRRGDSQLDKAGEVRDGYAGMFYLVANNKARPIIVSNDKARTPLVESDGKPYGGCFVHATVDIYAHDKPGLGKRIDATLLAVMFASDGDSFGGSKGTVSDFDDIPVTEEETADLF